MSIMSSASIVRGSEVPSFWGTSSTAATTATQ